MEQNGTLTAQQTLCLEALLGGYTATAAAERAGVGRTTVHRWQSQDFAFQAALNQGRADMQAAYQVRLEVLAEMALSAVEEAITHGDAKTGLAVLKGLGLLSGERPPLGSGDAATLERRASELALFEAMK